MKIFTNGHGPLNKMATIVEGRCFTFFYFTFLLIKNSRVGCLKQGRSGSSSSSSSNKCRALSGASSHCNYLQGASGARLKWLKTDKNIPLLAKGDWPALP